MADTYCGKSCADCAQREHNGCPGCKAGPGGFGPEECTIARCCKDRKFAACDACALNANCSRRNRGADMPEERRRAREAEMEKSARIAQKAPFLAKWIGMLFWLIIASIPVNVFLGYLVGIGSMLNSRGVEIFGQLLALIIPGINGYILLKLSCESEYYRVAGKCQFIAVAVNAVIAFIPTGEDETGFAWLGLLSLPSLIVAVIARYHEYKGHAEVLEEADPVLSAKWKELWQWYIILFASVFGCILIALLIPLVGFLLLLAVLIGMTVVGIMRLVYLSQTASLFKIYLQLHAYRMGR